MSLKSPTTGLNPGWLQVVQIAGCEPGYGPPTQAPGTARPHDAVALYLVAGPHSIVLKARSASVLLKSSAL